MNRAGGGGKREKARMDFPTTPCPLENSTLQRTFSFNCLQSADL